MPQKALENIFVMFYAFAAHTFKVVYVMFLGILLPVIGPAYKSLRFVSVASLPFFEVMKAEPLLRVNFKPAQNNNHQVIPVQWKKRHLFHNLMQS